MQNTQNVLFIIADQFRSDCLGCTGNPVIQTPNLDQLAAEGVAFTNCFNQTAPCGPSRASIYTSRYLCSTRSLNNQTPLLDAEDNFGFTLHQAGYLPGLIGYNDYAIDPAILPDSHPRKTSLGYDNVLPGFERILYHEYDSEQYFESLRQKGYPEELLNHGAIHSPDVPSEGPGEHIPQYFPAKYKKEDSECRFLTETAIDYIKTKQAEQVSNRNAKGWMLSLNYIKPHPPNICCEPYHRMYDPADMPAAARRPEELTSTHPYLQLINGTAYQNEKHLRELMAIYYGMISEVDDNLGLLFDTLRETDQWDNTVIIFTSDHGEYLGDHYLTGKGQFYDGAIHIPYIVRDPSREADATRGQQISGFVESIDSAPTILKFLGVEIPDRFQGHSLVELLRGEVDKTSKTEIHYEFDYRSGVLRRNPEADADKHLLWVVRDSDYKFVQFADEAMPPMLFDIKADAGEFENLADRPEHTATVLKYCQKLLRWRMYNEDQRMEHWAQQYR